MVVLKETDCVHPQVDGSISVTTCLHALCVRLQKNVLCICVSDIYFCTTGGSLHTVTEHLSDPQLMNNN